MPGVAHFSNHVEIQIGHDQRILITRCFRKHATPRIAKVTLPVKLSNVPRLFMAYAIDGADKVTVGDSVSRLFQLPQVLRKPGDRGRRIENDLRSV